MTPFINFLFVSLLVLASALAAPLHKRDVVDPPVTNPNLSTVWTTGSTQLVVWDTSKLPPYNQITNQIGTVVLGFLDSNGENLMLDKPLAKGFNITQGSVQVVVPNVPTRHNYIIVLMGDSGNASPIFTILGDSPSFIGNSTAPAPTPTEPTTTSDTSIPIPSPPPPNKGTFTGETTSVLTTTPGNESPTTSDSSVPTPKSISTNMPTTTSPSGSQTTGTKSNGASASVNRAGATCFGAAVIIAWLL